MPRIRDLGIYKSTLPPGPVNAITDVAGIRVGHCTLIDGEGEWRPGKGPFRTGVTVILPHSDNIYAEKVAAAVHTINGFGKVYGFEQVRELGQLETPIALTGTMNVPRVADAMMTLAIEENPYIGIGFEESGRQGYPSVNPVVGETSDGYLSDLQARPVGLAQVRQAYTNASSGPVREGAIGAGTGTSCFGWKGGIGSASRWTAIAEGGFTVGALVQTNYGRPPELRIAGVPVGLFIQPNQIEDLADQGSVMIILATDAPLTSRQLGRLCRRAAFGLARTGSTLHGGSGDFVIAFSTTSRIPDRPEVIIAEKPKLQQEQKLIGRLGLGVIEAVEEAVYNSLFMAETVSGRDGNIRYALPVEKVVNLVRNYRRLG